MGEGGLYVIDAQGDGERALTVNQPEGDETRFDSEPAWAPDGSRIAFTRRTGGLFRLHLVHPGGGPATPLTAARVDEGQPDWQPLGANASPACSSVRAVPARLWPPNHRLVQVELRGATDADGDRLSAAIGGVTQDEPVREGRHGALASDARRAAGHRVFLRAERDPSGDGRVYRIPFAISDGRGGGCSGAVTVVVPRSSRHRAVDSGQQFDSFGS